jgi:hypothetical protein
MACPAGYVSEAEAAQRLARVLFEEGLHNYRLHTRCCFPAAAIFLDLDQIERGAVFVEALCETLCPRAVVTSKPTADEVGGERLSMNKARTAGRI